MNNKEILKALRCCVYTECTKCPLNNGDPMDIECVSEMVRTAADLIEKMTDRCAVRRGDRSVAGAAEVGAGDGAVARKRR